EEEIKLFTTSLQTVGATLAVAQKKKRTGARPVPNENDKARLAVHFYFGDAAPFVTALNNQSIADIVGVDFYKTSLSSLPKKLTFDLIAGILDGRNSLIETPSAL